MLGLAVGDAERSPRAPGAHADQKALRRRQRRRRRWRGRGKCGTARRPGTLISGAKAVQFTAVPRVPGQFDGPGDVTSAPNTAAQTQLGVADRRRLARPSLRAGESWISLPRLRLPW